MPLQRNEQIESIEFIKAPVLNTKYYKDKNKILFTFTLLSIFVIKRDNSGTTDDGSLLFRSRHATMLRLKTTACDSTNAKIKWISVKNASEAKVSFYKNVFVFTL